MRCAVVGAGAWGTALADLLARNSHTVTLWAREPDVVETIGARRENSRFLPGATLSEGVTATGDMRAALEGAELVVYVPPSHVLRSVVRQGASYIARSATVVVASKGIERESLGLMTDVIGDELPAHAIVALSGPSFAAEVASRQPTAVVAASAGREAAALAQSALSNGHFRVYTNDDVTGVELGGALKNVMAVATGIAEGMGLGYNARAGLITRGLAEMSRLGVALGANPSTFAGLAGMGDLVLTCTGALSRNRALGMEIGQGRSLDEALAGKDTVAEGVLTTQSARDLAAREGVDMPIVTAVARILFEKQPAGDAIADLMNRGLRPEQDA